jgi:hypothetical protein
MLGLTFWHTTGGALSAKYLPWMNLGWFVLLGIGFVFLAMWFDYKFIYPARQSFLNNQSCKHENPAMALMIDTNNKQIEMKHDIDEINRSLAAIIIELKEIKEEVRD